MCLYPLCGPLQAPKQVTRPLPRPRAATPLPWRQGGAYLGHDFTFYDRVTVLVTPPRLGPEQPETFNR